MAVYDSRQMNKMRQDAIRRSQEMHRRSMVTSAHYSQGQQEKKESDTEQSRDSFHQMQDNGAVQRQAPRKDFQLQEALGKLLDGKIDGDKLIIIALMIILAREGADMKLILALGYILL